MDTRFLESFLIVAESGSIAAAARRLNLTPATLAQRLRALEADLGHALVHRVGRTVRPTAAGLAVLRHARLVVDAARDLRAIAANDEPVGQLRIGATASSLTGLLPDRLARLRDLYPRIEYFIRPGASLDLYHALLAGELDAAMVVKPQFPIPKSIGWLPIRREPLLLISAGPVTLDAAHAAIEGQPFIRYDRNQWGGQIVDRYLRAHNLQPREWLELDALDAIAALVDRQLGIAIVPDWAPPWPRGLRLHRLVLPAGELREVGLLWSRSGARIAAAKAFVEVCGALAETPRSDGTGDPA